MESISQLEIVSFVGRGPDKGRQFVLGLRKHVLGAS